MITRFTHRNISRSMTTAAVFLECGLGKTSITLTAIRDLMFDRFEIHKVLVIAPDPGRNHELAG